MKQIKINLHDKTYERMYNLIEKAKKLELSNNKKKPKPTTENDISKLLEKLVNEKEFQKIIKTMEDFIDGFKN